MNKINFYFFISLFFFMHQAEAYTLSKVSPINPKILVLMNQDEEVQKGDIFKIFRGDEFVTQVRVSMVKGKRFVARYMDGAVVQSIKPETFASLTFIKQDSSSLYGSKIRLSLNLMTAMNQITVVQTNSILASQESVAMKGSDFGFELNADYKLSSRWGLFSTLGYEMFKVTGQANSLACGGSATSECFVDLKYLTGAVGFKYYRDKSYGTYWMGVGAKLKSPLSKSTNTINEVDLTYAHSVLIHGGLDFKTQSNLYIPISVYYNHSLNTSETVTQIQNIGFTIGIGKSF